MRKYYVYIHTCPNGKKYVGCTTRSLEGRWFGRGYRGQNFQIAIEEFGWDRITHEVFEVDTEKEMYYLERYLIAFYNTTNPEKGYNRCPGGRTVKGVIRSSEYCRKQSESHKGKVPWNKGIPRDPLTREKISKTLSGRSSPKSEKWKLKVAEANRRKARDPERCRKISESHKHPKPLYQYLLPDGSIREMTANKAYSAYTKKGISVTKLQ